MERAASVSTAVFEAWLGKTRQARPLDQHALKLVIQLSDASTTATDAYSYGLLLRDSGLSPEFAYACLLKAQSLLHKSEPTPEFNSIVRARKELEKKLAGRSAKRSQDPEAGFREALALTLP